MPRSAPRGRGPHPLPRPRLYEQLVERLLAHVAEEGLGPGDRLPPERELARSLGVSRASLSQALVALEVQGVLDVRHGDGAVLRGRPSADAVLAALAERRARLPEVHEARQALEVKIAELAAVRRTPTDLARIDAALERMAAEVRAGERGERGDAEFHRAVTLAAHSGLLEDLMEAIARAIRDSRVESLAQPDRPRASLAGHRLIAAAVRDRDSSRAAAAMRAHLDLVADVDLLRDEPRADDVAG